MRRKLAGAGLRTLFFLALIWLIAARPQPAQAEITESGAQALQTALTELLALNQANDWLGLRLEWLGSLSVEADQDAGYYTAALPDLLIRLEQGRRIEIRNMIANFAPVRIATGGGEADGYDARIALPGSIPLVDADGEELAVMTIGEQLFALQWLPERGILPLADLRYANILLERRRPRVMFGDMSLPERIEIGVLSWQRQWAPKTGESTLWAGSETLQLDTIAVRDDRVEPILALGMFGLLAESDDILASTAAGPQNGSPDRFSAEVVMERLRVSPDNGVRVLKIPEIDYTLTGSGLRQDRGSFSLIYAHSGGEVTPPPSPPDLTPENLAAELTARDLPMQEFNQIGEEFARDSLRFDAETAQRRASEAARAAMAEAGTQIVLETLSADTPTADFTANGLILFDRQAEQGYLGGANLQLHELGAVMESIAGNPAYMFAYGPIIAMLRTLGETGETEDGSETVGFRLDVGPDGTVRVNGQDISVFLNPLLGLRPPAEIRP